MIKKKVTSLYQGKAYLKGEVLNKAQHTKEDIELSYKGKKMIIPNSRITKDNFTPHAHNPFKDNYGRGDYKLYGITFIE